MAYFIEKCNDMASRKKSPGLPFVDIFNRFQWTAIADGILRTLLRA